MVPTLVTAVALTGAAVVVPLQLSIDNRPVNIDLELPVQCTTASGQQIDCTYGLYFSTADGRPSTMDAAVDKLRARDWSDIGQEIYEYAVAHPVSPKEGEVWEVDNRSRSTLRSG